MSTLHRIVVPLINAFFVTAVLLYLMFYLVRIDEPILSTPINWSIPEFTGIPDEPEVTTMIAKPIKPAPLVDVPEIPQAKPSPDLDPIEGPNLGVGFKPKFTEGLAMPLNNQLVLALGYPPAYPNSAIYREIQGYAVVGFSVSASGAVFDPFIIESEPNSIFDRSALKAISKFKYKARMVDGKPVATDGQRYLFRYELDGKN